MSREWKDQTRGLGEDEILMSIYCYFTFYSPCGLQISLSLTHECKPGESEAPHQFNATYLWPLQMAIPAYADIEETDSYMEVLHLLLSQFSC